MEIPPDWKRAAGQRPWWEYPSDSPTNNAVERQAKAELTFSRGTSPLDLYLPPLQGLGWGTDIPQTVFCRWTQDTGRQRSGTQPSPTARFMNYSAWEASALRKGKSRDKENVQKVHKDKCL